MEIKTTKPAVSLAINEINTPKLIIKKVLKLRFCSEKRNNPNITIGTPIKANVSLFMPAEQNASIGTDITMVAYKQCNIAFSPILVYPIYKIINMAKALSAILNNLNLKRSTVTVLPLTFTALLRRII